MAVNPKSIENLRPWTSETAPKGRKNIGLSTLEHMNSMADLSKQALEAIRDDESEAMIRRHAATKILDAKELWEVVEHTHSKPIQRHEVASDVILRTPHDRAAEATAASDRLRAILDPSKN